jgi:hypothetical protein
MLRKTFSLLLLLATSNFAHAAEPTAYCDEGDSHIVVIGTRAAPVIKYSECEFHDCQYNGHAIAKLVAQTATSATYDVGATNQTQTLLVKYDANNLVTEVIFLTNGYMSSDYQNCAHN